MYIFHIKIKKVQRRVEIVINNSSLFQENNYNIIIYIYIIEFYIIKNKTYIVLQ